MQEVKQAEMYVITIENGGTDTVIHEPGSSQVKVDGAKISREVNKFDSLTFTIYPGNPGFDLLTPFATLVKVLNISTGATAFEGRVIQPVPSMESDGSASRSVTCEGVMGYLCDSMQEWQDSKHWDGSEEEGINGLQEYIMALLAVHNSKVEEYKRIYPGNITLQTFDTTDGVTKGVSRDSTWENLESKLIESFGGEMRVRRDPEDGLLYLDYAESLGVTRSTRIQVARNMEDAQREIDPNAVITRFYPYGAKLTTTEVDPDTGEETEVETEERLTIESVNEGRAYIDDAVAIEQYGIIEGYHEWDDVTLPANLLSKGQQWLGSNNAMPTSHTFSALDLSLIGLDPDGFEIFDSYPCYNPLLGIDETLEIVKQTIDINSPEDSTFDMGESSFRLSADIDKGDITDAFEDFQSQTESGITNVGNRVVSTQAAIKVFEDRIEQTVSQQISEANQSIQNITEMVQNWDGWEFNFTEITEQITELGTIYGTQLRYIKFIDGEIWLGRDPDPGEDDFKVVISNERIRFLQNNIEVAYITGQKLYITDASITHRLEIGSFAFFPRENGNMTLRYIG